MKVNIMSEQIKKLRKERGETLEQFAHTLGVTLGTVWRWENSKNKPSPLAIEKIHNLEKKEIAK